MGDHGGRAQPGGLFPTGLLPNTAAGVGRSLDMERWSKAEERTAELIARIQPNRSSEERRNAVSSYVQRLIMKCFSCRVFTFGSVPLKTYLPDGDIDLTAFSENENLKDTWANEVRDALENEEKNENAEYHVKEVQYIQAEVKIIKCLVEDIVVDISFNQVGGLCTLCFLDEIDSLINQNHLFKQSVILTKAWCYYESRILGAHHGLISTYALETLVLYIFHVYNNSFAGPLEVLYRFLEFFSNFDWGNFCVSLWGPIPISSLPNMIAEPPREDGGDLLLSKLFLDVCSAVYAVLPAGQENQGQPFVSKYFNIVDPLRINNNLGRSVSKGNFFRIRSAFAFGAKSLARLLECPKEDLIAEVNQFFTNTWERHGNGTNPDAPIPNRWPLQPSKTTPVEEFNNIKKSENNALLVCHEYQIDGGLAFHGRPTSKVLKKTNISSRGSAQIEIQNNKKYLRPDQFQEGQDSFQFPRTHSSPDLTDISAEALVRGSRNKVHESGKHHIAPSRLDHGGRIKNSGFDEPSPSRHHRPSPTLEAADSHSTCNSYHGSEEQIALVSETTLDMHQEEQDLVNMMASSRVHNVGEQVQLPIHLPSHVPFPVSSSLISYNHRIPMIDPSWGPMQYPQDRIFHEDEAGSNRSNPDNKKQTTLGQFYSVSSSRASNSEAYVRGYDKVAREHKVPVAEDDDGAFQFQTTARNGNMVPFPVSKAVSSRSKPAFECALDGSDKAPKPARDKRGRRDAASMILSALGKSRTRRQLEGSSDQDSSQADDEASPQGRSHESPGREPAEVSEPAEIKCSDSVVPVAPMQRVIQNPGVLPFTFYPTGPLVPFLAMLPVYNFPDGSSGQLDSSERLDHGQTNPSGQNESLSSSDACAEPSEEHKSDILNSDFSSHWENLQYGRSCQSTRHVGPFIYPSPVVVPPVYLQGHFPWDGPGRPHSPNLNTFSQVMSYGPPQVPVAPLQQGLGTSVLPEGSRYRGGTGTYLPNPKVPSRDRVPSSSSRNQRVNYNTDHNDHDREGSWINPKSRANPSRSHGRTRAEKPVSRTDRSSTFDNRRPWTSHRHESPDLYQPAHNSSFMSTNSSHNSVNMTYGVYPLSGANSNGMNLNRPLSYGSHNEPPDLGSLGVVNEVARPRDENPPREEYRVRHGAHQGSSRSSPG